MTNHLLDHSHYYWGMSWVHFAGQEWSCQKKMRQIYGPRSMARCLFLSPKTVYVCEKGCIWSRRGTRAESESWNRIQMLGTRKANTFVVFIVHVAFYHISYYKDEKQAHLDWYKGLKRGWLTIGRVCLWE